jgi:hypothetical protein
MVDIDELDTVEKWIIMVLGTLGEVEEEKLKLIVLLLTKGFGDIWTDSRDEIILTLEEKSNSREEEE